MKTDLSIVKKNLSDLRATSHQDSKFKVEFKKADGSFFSVNSLTIPKWLPEGEYTLTAYCLDGEEAEIIMENDTVIEAKKENPPEAISEKIKTTGDPSFDLLFRLRDQDQAAWEKERNLIEKYWQTEVSRIRNECSNEIKALTEKHNFEMSLIKKNSDVLESERDKIRDSVAKEYRFEKRNENSNRKKTLGDRLFDIVDSNPEILLSIFEKFNVVDPETAAALKEMSKAANNIQAGDAA